MKVIYSLDQTEITENSGITLGTFDGLHRGHQKLIKNLVSRCKEQGFKSIVYTFANHPRELTLKNAPKRLINMKKKIEILNNIGIDYLLLLNFDNFQRNIDPEMFVYEILIKKLKMKEMSVGFDCKFGKNASGNTDLLAKLSKKYNFSLSIVEPYIVDNQIVSSTLIRQLIQDGNILKANNLLGRYYSITGNVIKGKQIGRKLGYPTANILIDYNMCLPKGGVYITETIIDSNSYKSVTNVGYNPTFNQKNYNIETHILNFNESLYGNDIDIIFHKRIRDEIKFYTIEQLCTQIDKDINITNNYFDTIKTKSNISY